MNDLDDIPLRIDSFSYRDIIGQRMDATPRTNPRTVVASTSSNPLDDEIRANCSSGPIVITVETAIGADGRRHVYKKIDSTTNPVTVSFSVGQTGDGLATIALSQQYQAMKIIANGVTWDLETPTVAVYSSIVDSGLTPPRVVYSSTSGLLVDSANMTFNGSTLSTVSLGASANVSSSTLSTGTVSAGTNVSSATVSTGTVNAGGLVASGTNVSSATMSTGVFNAGGLIATATNLSSATVSTGTINTGGLISGGTNVSSATMSTGVFRSSGLASVGTNLSSATVSTGTASATFMNAVTAMSTANLNVGTIIATSTAKLMSATAIPGGGSIGAGFTFFSVTNFGIFGGSTAPTMIAGQGSIYLRSDGGSVSTRIYVNTNGVSTWTGITTLT